MDQSIQTDEYYLSNVEVNKMIQHRTCKIMTETEEGTGYVIDPHNGWIITSFHLVGELSHPSMNINNFLYRMLCDMNFISIDKFKNILKEIISIEKLKNDFFDLKTKNVNDKEYCDQIDVVMNDYAQLSSIYNFSRIMNERRLRIKHQYVDIDIGDEVLKGCVEINQNTIKNYAYFDMVLIKVINPHNSIKYIQIEEEINKMPKIEYFPSDEQVSIGETIYFGGYPLGQTTYAFSTGVISSIIFTDYRRSYIIEGFVNPGHSGTSVFVQKNKKIYLLGLINSEIAIVSEQMMSYRNKLLNSDHRATIIANGINITDAIKESVITSLNNMCTGKAKIHEIQKFEDLYNPNFIDWNDMNIDVNSDFLISKKKEREQRKKEHLNEHTHYAKITKIQYFTFADDHGSKHTEFSGRINKHTLKTWHEKKMPATFNVGFKNNYNEILKKIIILFMEENENENENEYLTNKNIFFKLNEFVGWSQGTDGQGEETNFIQLYYYKGIGSHMRPITEWEVNKLKKNGISTTLIDIKD